MVEFLPLENMELNDLRKIICLRKSEVSVQRTTKFSVIKKLTEHDIHSRDCLPY